MFKDGMFIMDDVGSYTKNRTFNTGIHIKHELRDFATEFSVKYRQYPPGIYFSRDKNFCINYLDKIMSPSGQEFSTPARVSLQTGNIELSKSKLMGYDVTDDFIFYIIIFSHVNYRFRDLAEADKIALDYYKKNTRRSLKSLIKPISRMFENNPTRQNAERLQYMLDFVFKSQQEADDLFRADDEFEFKKMLLILSQ